MLQYSTSQLLPFGTASSHKYASGFSMLAIFYPLKHLISCISYTKVNNSIAWHYSLEVEHCFQLGLKQAGQRVV